MRAMTSKRRFMSDSLPTGARSVPDGDHKRQDEGTPLSLARARVRISDPGGTNGARDRHAAVDDPVPGRQPSLALRRCDPLLSARLPLAACGMPGAHAVRSLPLREG